MDNFESFNDQSSTATEDNKNDTFKRPKHKRKKNKNTMSGSDSEYEVIKLQSVIDELIKDREQSHSRIKELETEIQLLKELLAENSNAKLSESIKHNNNNNSEQPKYIGISTPNTNISIQSEISAKNINDWAAEASEDFSMAKPKIKPKERRNVKVRIIQNAEEEMETTPVSENIIEASNTQGTQATPQIMDHPEKTGKVSPPPLFKIYNSNVKEIVTKAREKLGHNNFTINIVNKNMVTLKVINKEDHTKIKNLLNEHKYSFFTYTPKDEKPISLVIKKLSSTWDENDIRSYLEEKKLNIKILKLIKLEGNKWIFKLSHDSDIKAFRRQQFMLNEGIKIQNYKREGFIMCKNCQRHGHVAGNCNMPYRCVKCRNSEHGPGNCPIPPKEKNNEEIVVTDPITGQVKKSIGLPVYCCNCDVEGHVASYKKCPTRLKLLERLSQKKENVQINKPKTLFVNPNFSYSNAVKAGQQSLVNNKAPKNGNAFEIFNNDCKNLIGKDMLTTLRKIQEYSKMRNQLKTDEEKAQAILGLLLELRLND